MFAIGYKILLTKIYGIYKLFVFIQLKYNNYNFYWIKTNNLYIPYILVNNILYPIANMHIHSKELYKFLSNNPLEDKFITKNVE